MGKNTKKYVHSLFKKKKLGLSDSTEMATKYSLKKLNCKAGGVVQDVEHVTPAVSSIPRNSESTDGVWPLFKNTQKSQLPAFTWSMVIL